MTDYQASLILWALALILAVFFVGCAPEPGDTADTADSGGLLEAPGAEAVSADDPYHHLGPLRPSED